MRATFRARPGITDTRTVPSLASHWRTCASPHILDSRPIRSRTRLAPPALAPLTILPTAVGRPPSVYVVRGARAERTPLGRRHLPPPPVPSHESANVSSLLLAYDLVPSVRNKRRYVKIYESKGTRMGMYDLCQLASSALQPRTSSGARATGCRFAYANRVGSRRGRSLK